MDILPQLLVNSLIQGSIYAIASAGLALSYGLLRVLNFAHGHFMMVGAYCFYFMLAECQQGMLMAALFTALFMLALGAGAYFVAVKPFMRLSTLLSFVTTLALGAVFEATISMGFGVNVKSLPVTGLFHAAESGGQGAHWGSDSLEFGGIYVTPVQVFIIVSAAGTMTLLALLVHVTAVGRTLRALSEHRYAAESLGRHHSHWGLCVFCLATFMAGFSGILVGLETNLQPTMGQSYTIKAFAAMIVGGLGNIWGTVLGSYVIGLIENLSIGLDFGGYSLPAGYKDAFAFVCILVVLLVRPQGVFNRAARSV